MVGCIIKSSQGLGPGVSPQNGHSLTWFKDNWTRILAAAGARYGLEFFRGAYHFGTPTATGAAQADYMLLTVESAGGWRNGDLPPAWDLEGATWSSAQQIIDVSSQFAERIKQQLGKAPILYTGATWRKFGLRTRAGFGALWTTHLDVMVPFGWPNTDVVLHQYGDGKYYDPQGQPARLMYPTGVLGFGTNLDMNVVMDGGRPATSIDRVRTVLTGQGGSLFEPSYEPAPGGFFSRTVNEVKRDVKGLSTPVLVGAGLGALALIAIIASSGRDDTY
jgi:hypothetical protein